MTVHDDDIGGLFKAIGGKNKQFKEFSNQSEAAHARERWPLFKTVSVEKRLPPPQLMQSEKQLWQKQDESPPMPVAKAKGLTLGNKIARGLSKLTHPASSVPAHPLIHPHTQPAAHAAPAPAQEPLPAATRRLPPLTTGQHGKLFETAPPPAETPLKRGLGAGKNHAKARGGLFSAAAVATPARAGIHTSAPAGAHTDAPASVHTGAPAGVSKFPGKSGALRDMTRPGVPEAEAPRRLFGHSQDTGAPVKKLFGTGPKPGIGGASGQRSHDAPSGAKPQSDNLGNLFARLGDAAPPAGGKNRGLFNRMGKS